MSASPQFAVTPINPHGAVSTANANRDGSGTTLLLYTVPTGGVRIDDIVIKARATTTAGMIRFFLSPDGVAYRLLKEVPVTAITPSATVQSFESILSGLGWVLSAGMRVYASTEKGEAFDISVTRGGGFQ